MEKCDYKVFMPNRTMEPCGSTAKWDVTLANGEQMYVCQYHFDKIKVDYGLGAIRESSLIIR